MDLGSKLMAKLIIGNFYDGTGFAQAAIRIAEALSTCDDVIIRSIKLTGQTVDPGNHIKALAAKPLKNIDTVLSITLPPYFSYQGGIRNIGMGFWETTNFRASNWANYCNLLDKLLVSCEQNRQSCLDSGVKVPIGIIPVPCNPHIYTKGYEPLDVGQGKRYVFLFVGDYSSKKAVTSLISSYLEEFSKDDDCVLVLKTYVEGVSSNESVKLIQEDINKIKQGLRRFGVDKYPPIILLPGYLDNDTMYRLYAAADCFVTAEKGCAWNLPLFDSIGFGAWTICNGWGGHLSYHQDGIHGVQLKYNMTTVKNMTRCPYPTIFTAHEQWAEIDYEQLKQEMRAAYYHRYLPAQSDVEAFRSKWSCEAVGPIIREALC